MAAPHAFVVFSIKDAKNATSVMKVNFPAAVDIGVLRLNFGPTTATLINAIIKGKITEVGVGLAVDISGATIRATPDPDSDVEEGARFSWLAANNANTEFRMPTFDEAKMVAGTREVDTADADVDAFVQRIIAGQTVGLTNVSPSTDRGEDITVLDTARESFTSSRT
jgi:hypothetical protein